MSICFEEKETFWTLLFLILHTTVSNRLDEMFSRLYVKKKDFKIENYSFKLLFLVPLSLGINIKGYVNLFS